MSVAESNKNSEQTSGGASPAPVWTQTDLKADPHAQEDKPAKVRSMFASIAHRYDLNNRLHSFGRDQSWRRAAVREASPRLGETVLDVACGTGDLTRLFARSGASQIIGVDFCPEMLAVAERKTKNGVYGRAPIEYLEGDAMNLPQEDHSINIVSIAFGLRNVADPAKAISEFARVLRPGGRLVVLEFSRPRSPLIAFFNDVYSRRIMPWSATLLSGDKTGAYRYLPRSIDTFLDRQGIAQLMRDAGFGALTICPLTFGVCTLHRGVAT